MSQSSFVASFTGQNMRQYRDPKRMGLCGAPQCRCTPLLLAMCIALSGLVFLGVGGCIVGFMWNDDAPKALGASLLSIGLIMILIGCGFFVYDNYLRARGQVGGYPYHHHDGTQFDQSSSSSSACTTSHQGARSDMRMAPPAYHAVLTQSTDTGHHSKAGSRTNRMK